MRKQLLLSTAALLAGVAMASAQSMPSGGGGHPSGPAAQSVPSGGHPSGAATQSAPNGGQQTGPAAQNKPSGGQPSGPAAARQGAPQHAQQGLKEQGRTTGQGSSGQALHEQQSKQSQHEQGLQGAKPGQSKSASGRNEQTTGQSSTQQRERSEGQGLQREQALQREREHGQAAPSQGKTGQSQMTAPQQGQAKFQQNQAGGGASLTAEQRTRIRESVLASNNVPRVDNVNFALRAGTVVPDTVRIAEVPETLVEIYPEWRGDEYFVVHDDIVIVDHSHRIVAMLPGTSGNAYASSRERSSDSMGLGQAEIRQLQVALREKGFDVGEADGVLGPRTKNALMQFQQRQGFQASGRLDQQTVAALGINVRGRESGQSGPSSMGQGGQGGSTMHQPSTGAGQQGSPAATQPSTSGQSNRTMQEPRANQGGGITNNPSATPSGQTPHGMTGSGSPRLNEQRLNEQRK